eukprot:TRINITY_DN11725_c0_g4_i4.p1 TRINITY_DN11725_c0_g4~~TRINITY_DN11725_c0_g4_i4.p1  ORF type:complete len:201 (+),score=41.78 TRINITY_DN11725_c0_g4_i4:565-1167(+)
MVDALNWWTTSASTTPLSMSPPVVAPSPIFLIFTTTTTTTTMTTTTTVTTNNTIQSFVSSSSSTSTPSLSSEFLSSSSLSSLSSSSLPLSSSSICFGLDTFALVNDFSCLHYNWYGRKVRRNFRFCQEVFMRINPDTGEIRGTQRYDEILHVSHKHSDMIIINYKNGNSSDWIESSSTTITLILDFFSRKIPGLRIEKLF